MSLFVSSGIAERHTRLLLAVKNVLFTFLTEVLSITFDFPFILKNRTGDEEKELFVVQ